MRRSRIIASLLVLAIVFESPALFASSQRELKQKELSALQDRIRNLRSELKGVRREHSLLQDELEHLERKLGELASALRNVDRKLAGQRRRLSELRDRQRQLRDKVASQREHLARQIRAAYAMGRQEYLKILLNQEDPAALGRALTYYDYLNKARSERIDGLLGNLKELEQVRLSISRETDRLNVLRAQRQAQIGQLEHSRAERGDLLAKLDKELSSKSARLNTMLANEKELQSLVAALAEALEDIPDEAGRSFTELRGKLSWPAAGPRLASFGGARASGHMRWRGVLIQAKAGQSVHAISHGRVVFADWLRGYGLLIIIDHGDGYMSLYGHNQSLYKETGDWVEAGDVIASVGNSGGQDRTALYFEIRHNGEPTDPARWCRRG